MAKPYDTFTMRFDGAAATALLAELAKASPEARNAFFSALDAGEHLFLLESDNSLTRRTGEMVVRLKPTDRLLGLLPTTGAGN